MKKRVLEVEQTNEVATIALSRTQASIRRLRLEYAILIERLEDRAQHLPDGVTNFEEMAGPSTPSILDEHLVKSSKNGTSKKSTKKLTGGKLTGNASSSSPGAGPEARNLINNIAGASSTENATATSTNPALAKNPKYRDPDLPKRPTNAYLLFCEQEKERLRQQQQEDPENNTRDLSKAMTEAWKALSEEDRKPFYKLYEEDRVRYQKEMAEYNQKKEAEMEQAGDDEGEVDTNEGGDDNEDENEGGDVEEEEEEDEEEEVEEEEEEEGEELEQRNGDERETKRQKIDNGVEVGHVEQTETPEVKIEEEKVE